MADPISITAILGGAVTVVEVVGTVIAIVSSLFSFFEFGAIILYFVATMVIAFIKNTIYYAGMCFIVPFQGFFGFCWLNGRKWVKDLQTTKFDSNPLRRNRNNPSAGVIQLSADAFQEVRLIIQDFITFISPLFVGLSYTIPLGIVIVLIAASLYVWTVPILVTIDSAHRFYYYASDFVALYLTLVYDFAEQYAPVWNGFVTFGEQFFATLLSLACPTSPWTGSIAVDCPPIYQMYVFLLTGLEWWLNLIELILQSFYVFLVALGQIICPAGVCPAFTCQQILGTSVCYWDLDNPTFIVKYLLVTGFEIFTTTVFLVSMILFLGLDIVGIFLYTCGFIFSRIIPSNLTTAFTNLANSGLSSIQVPASLQGLKDFGIIIENTVFALFSFIASVFEAGFALLEIVICNVIKEPLNCGAWKICNAFLRPFYVPFGEINIYIDLPRVLCTDVLGASPGRCFWKCDTCAFKPFGVTLYLSWWYDANVYFTGNILSGYSFTPCNIRDRCCNTAYALTATIFGF